MAWCLGVAEMKRIIRTPGFKLEASKARDQFVQLVASQVADFILTAEQWKGIVDVDMLPAMSAQMQYLAHANLAFGDHVMLLTPLPDRDRYEHVRLQVCGAVSFALPGVARSAYNYSRGHARVYVRVELDMPPLRRLSRWLPGERLQRKTNWKEMN